MNLMKKVILASLLLCTGSAAIAESAEQYAKEIDKISMQYNKDMKSFIRGLDSQTKQLNPQQNIEFCKIVVAYVDDFYKVTDKNRQSLPVSYANMSKQDVVQKVMQSREMMILSKYNIQCDFTR